MVSGFGGGSAAPAIEAEIELLCFWAADEEYAIEILRVQEIKGDTILTRIPNTPAHVLGVTNLRGAIIPIIDLRLKFGLPCEAHGQLPVVIIGFIGDKTVGLAVDAVSDVVDIAADDVQPTPELATASDGGAIRGIAHAANRLIALLDLDAIATADVAAAA